MLPCPAGATASPVASQHKIGSFRFKSSSDSRRIPDMLEEENVAALGKVWVQYNLLFPSIHHYSLPPLLLPCKRSTAVISWFWAWSVWLCREHRIPPLVNRAMSARQTQPSSSFTANSACDFHYRNLVSYMQLLRAQLSAMHDLQQLLPAIHQLRAMHQEMAPVLHEVQAWQQNVRLLSLHAPWETGLWWHDLYIFICNICIMCISFCVNWCTCEPMCGRCEILRITANRGQRTFVLQRNFNAFWLIPHFCINLMHMCETMHQIESRMSRKQCQ